MIIYWAETQILRRRVGGTLFVASKKGSLEANAEKTRYILFASHKNTGQNHNIVTFSFGKVAKLTFLGKTINKSKLVACFLLGNSPASEFYMPTFWNTVPSS